MDYNNSYAIGIEAEKHAKDILRRYFHVTESSKEDNIDRDVDCYISKTSSSTLFSVSIKYQYRTYQTGNVAFEVAKANRDGNWYPGWFHSGQAFYYGMLVPTDSTDSIKNSILYLGQAQPIKDWIKENGFDSIRTNSKAIVQSNERQGHADRTAKNGLIKLSTLCNTSLLKVLNAP